MNRMTKILKSVFSAALALSLVAGIPAAAWANNDGTDSGYRVNDFTGLLTDDQELSLSRAARAEVGPLQFDFNVYLTDESGSAQALTQSFYQENNCGYGQDDDGIILCMKSDGSSAVYVAGLGSVVFSDKDTASLASASSGQATVKEGPTTADLPWYPDDPKAFQDFHNEAAPRVVDNADLLTPDQEELLAAHIADMRERLGLERCPWYGSRAAHREQRQRHGRYHLRHVRGWRLRQGHFDPV